MAFYSAYFASTAAVADGAAGRVVTGRLVVGLAGSGTVGLVVVVVVAAVAVLVMLVAVVGLRRTAFLVGKPLIGRRDGMLDMFTVGIK